MAVTTNIPRAQAFFNQGVRLLYAFNHAEARRAFQEAARLDPGLAMAYWGQALTLAPNLNAPMTAESGREAFAAIGRFSGSGRVLVAQGRAADAQQVRARFDTAWTRADITLSSSRIMTATVSASGRR